MAAPGQFGERSRLANARHPVIRTRVIASKLTPDDGMVISATQLGLGLLGLRKALRDGTVYDLGFMR